MLTREAIVDAGLEILQRYGLADLTMRRLAEALDVRAGALYYHVANKQSLLAALSDHILSDVREPAAELPPQEWLSAWAGALHDALTTYRDGAEVVASTLALGLGEQDPREVVRRYLCSQEHPQADAIATALLYFALGHVTMEQTRCQLSELGVVEGFDRREAAREYRAGIDLVIAGALSHPR